MGIELRSTDDPNAFEIFDAHGNIGSIWYTDPDDMEIDEDDDCEQWVAGWVASMGRAKPIARDWYSEPQATIAEAVREAWTMHGWLLEDRREGNRFYRNRGWRDISTPMGGQPR